MTTFLKLAILFFLISTTLVFGQIPQTMSYQGVLTNANGELMNGSISLTFKLYDSVSDGTNLWEETQSVDVMNGIFNVILGGQNPLELPFDKQYWLGIAIEENDELEPRIQLTSAPYTLNSNVQPKPGESISIKNQDGEVTHIFSPTGDELNSPSALNKLAIDSGPVSVTKGKIYTYDLCIALPDPSEQSGLFPLSRFDSTGLKVKGSILAENFTIINALGDTLIAFRRDGTSFHKGEEVFAGGIKLQGIKGITFADGTRQTTAGSGSGASFEGTLTGKPLILVNAEGDTVFKVDTDGRSVHKGQEVFLDGIKLTDEKGGPGMFIEQQSILTFDDKGDGVNFLGPDGAIFLKKVSLRDTLEIKDADGNVTTQFLPDGTSLHKGQEVFLDGIKLTDENDGPGILIEQQSILTFNDQGGISNFFGPSGALFTNKVSLRDTLEIKDANGNVTTQFLPDGTSLHKGDETFEADVILKGTDGKGIKLVDQNGNILAGFGREDTDTGQRIGVFGRADNADDLAAVFEGNVDVLGEIIASSLHIVNTDGDTLTNFNADGTSYHKGKETFAGGIEITNADGSAAVEIKPDTNPNTEYAVSVNGNLRVDGIMMAQTKQFRIDHPLDPKNRYLHHTSVESPDMKNVYDGVITLNENGDAWVSLPEWFEALNKDFRYQLTCIGGYANVYIKEEIKNNTFKISGGIPGLKVSWQVTGIRDDSFARANRNPVESLK